MYDIRQRRIHEPWIILLGYEVMYDLKDFSVGIAPLRRL